MPEHVEEIDYRGLSITIDYDTDSESPREWCNLGRMVCWHSRYNLGDCDRKNTRASAEDGTEFREPDDFQQWWKENGNGGVILPLYLYDHSGITMSCGAFSCPWDSGQVGWIYVTANRIRHEYGCKRITKALRDQVDKTLRQEVETYDEYLTGQVYCFTVNDPDGDGDSCCGFYGLDYCIQQAKEAADHIADKRDAAVLIEAQYS